MTLGITRMYEEEYFTIHPYDPYRDWSHHGKRVNKIIKLCNPKSVLDVGCAYGYIVKRLLDKGIVAYGTDVSEYASKQSCKVIPGRFIRCDLRFGLPFKDKVFDLLYCEGVLEHIEESFIESIMSEFERVSNQRLLAISLSSHPEAPDHEGHVTVKSAKWWIDKMPDKSLLYVSPYGTEDKGLWAKKDGNLEWFIE